jgi:hypothetical protein
MRTFARPFHNPRAGAAQLAQRDRPTQSSEITALNNVVPMAAPYRPRSFLRDQDTCAHRALCASLVEASSCPPHLRISAIGCPYHIPAVDSSVACLPWRRTPGTWLRSVLRMTAGAPGGGMLSSILIVSSLDSRGIPNEVGPPPPRDPLCRQGESRPRATVVLRSQRPLPSAAVYQRPWTARTQRGLTRWGSC